MTLALVATMGAGCGQQQGARRQTGPGETQPAQTTPATGLASPTFRAHPQAIEPVAGSAAPASAAPAAPSAVSVGPSSGSGSGSGSGPGSVAQPVSEAQVRQELVASGLSASPTQATLTRGGLAIAPIDAPAPVTELIAAGNQIARLPYRFGGGHGTFEDTAYDCSGSLSFVFAASGLLNTTMTSGQLMSWGAPGPGKWITVFAAPGHTFMYVAGLRFDTVALAETRSRWSNRSADEHDLRSFVARHPPGL
jgi:hypothetical protein